MTKKLLWNPRKGSISYVGRQKSGCPPFPSKPLISLGSSLPLQGQGAWNGQIVKELKIGAFSSQACAMFFQGHGLFYSVNSAFCSSNTLAGIRIFGSGCSESEGLPRHKALFDSRPIRLSQCLGDAWSQITDVSEKDCWKVFTGIRAEVSVGLSPKDL